MKKIIKLLGISGMLIMLAGCQKMQPEGKAEVSVETSTQQVEDNKTDEAEAEEMVSNQEDEDIIVITEKMYVSYINDIYTNAENYLGKTIRMEGMFTSAYEESTGETYYFVYRIGPGCCGTDGDMCGIEFTTSGDIPQENDWIEVTGTLDEYEQNGYLYLTLRGSTVTVKSERGLENVYQ